jgi:hypothetical protein
LGTAGSELLRQAGEIAARVFGHKGCVVDGDGLVGDVRIRHDLLKVEEQAARLARVDSCGDKAGADGEPGCEYAVREDAVAAAVDRRQCGEQFGVEPVRLGY